MFSVVYRPPDKSDFFEKFAIPLEKAWLKTSNIVLLGDLNCDLSNVSCEQDGLEGHGNSAKLLSIFNMFNMHNVIKEATRVTLTTTSLIDLIVTTKKELVRLTGVFPLGISDHNLIYATFRLKLKRPPPKTVKTRYFKRMNLDDFKQDIAATPFHIASIFDDPDDYLWVWQKLYTDICDAHAPVKEVRVT